MAGNGAAVVIGRRTIRRDRYESHLHVVELAGSRTTRRLTDGRVRDTSPRVSPEGSLVAFLRSDPDDDDAPNRICTVGLEGGKVRTIAPAGSTPGFGAIGELAWAPDGRSIAFTADVDPPRFIVGDRPPIGSASWRSSKTPTPVARRIARSDWRWDEIGHRDHWSHLFVLELAPGAKPRQVTQGDWGVSGITWHPNGRTVAFVSDQGPDPDLHPCTRIWAVDLDAGPRSKRSRPRLLLDAPGGASRPSFSPDGRWLAAVGSARAGAARRSQPRFAAGPCRWLAPAGRPGPRAGPADRQLGRHRPPRLDGRRPLRAGLAGRPHDRGIAHRSRP